MLYSSEVAGDTSHPITASERPDLLIGPKSAVGRAVQLTVEPGTAMPTPSFRLIIANDLCLWRHSSLGAIIAR